MSRINYWLIGPWLLVIQALFGPWLLFIITGFVPGSGFGSWHHVFHYSWESFGSCFTELMDFLVNLVPLVPYPLEGCDGIVIFHEQVMHKRQCHCMKKLIGPSGVCALPLGVRRQNVVTTLNVFFFFFSQKKLS